MNKRATVGVWMGTVTAAWLSGCAGSESPEAMAEREELRAMTAKLERRISELQTEIETMRAERTTELKATVQDMLRAELDAMIQTTVVARVEQKLGDKAQVDRLVRDTVMDTLAAVEAQKRAEEEARREQERLEREQRRAQFEEERWNRAAQELGLNEAQKEQMRAVNQAIRGEIDALVAQFRDSGQMPDLNSIRQSAQQLKSKYEGALAQVLTPEQIAAYRNQPFSLLRMLDAMSGGEGGPGFFMRRGGGDDGDRRRGPPR